jgi:hypothetical protein
MVDEAGVGARVGAGVADGRAESVGDDEADAVGLGAVVFGAGGGGGAWPGLVVPPYAGFGNDITGWPASAAVMKACQVLPAVEAPVASVAVLKMPFNDCL